MILWLSYLHNGISYTGKMTSLYWIGAQILLNLNNKSLADPNWTQNYDTKGYHNTTIA